MPALLKRFFIWGPSAVLGTLLLAAVLVATSPPVLAAGGGDGHGGGDDGGGHGAPAAEAGNRPDKQANRPRADAANVGGTYMQLNALWLPILKNRRMRYQAITVRLMPRPDRRAAACMKAPWAQEAVLFELNEAPLALDDLADVEHNTGLQDRILNRIHTHIGEDLYSGVSLLSGIHEPDMPERELSFMCH